MSLLREFPSAEIRKFGGAWLLTDKSMVPRTAALRSLNIEFLAGRVGTRHGFGPITTPFGAGFKYLEMYAWYGPFTQITDPLITADSVMVLLHDSVGFGTLLSAFIVNDLSIGFTPFQSGTTFTGAASASFVGSGMRLYYVTVDTAQDGIFTTGQVCTVYNGSFGALASRSHLLFSGPLAYVPAAPTEPGAGAITAGVHRLAYLIEYISGFTTRMSPDAGTLTPPDISTFRPLTFTATGGLNATWVLNPPFVFPWDGGWPDGAVAVSVCMTTTTNLNQYYIVPGTRTVLGSAPSAGPSSTSITFSISDADLSVTGIDATPYLYKLTSVPWARSNPSGTLTYALPFVLRHVAPAGDRMGYLCLVSDPSSTHGASTGKRDAVFYSERNDFETITADQHMITLSSGKITTIFRLGNSNYISGPHELYMVNDNGDTPVNWPSPSLIDGRHGTLAIHGAVAAPSGNYAWLADQSGLFVFTGGPITDLPVSHEQSPDWDRINWEAAYCLTIKDDPGEGRVYVRVALDGATTPSHIMVWDYNDGIGWDKVRYSLWSLANFTLGGMELFRNDLAGQVSGNKKKIELWVSSRAAVSTILRQMSDVDTNPFRDQTSTAISCNYRTAPLPGRDRTNSLIQLHHGFTARITGAGTITPTLYDIDAIRSFTCKALTLSTTPNQDELFLADLRNELAFIEFATNTANTYFNLAYLKYYHSPYLMQR